MHADNDDNAMMTMLAMMTMMIMMATTTTTIDLVNEFAKPLGVETPEQKAQVQAQGLELVRRVLSVLPRDYSQVWHIPKQTRPR
jgi:hypothetical protein